MKRETTREFTKAFCRKEERRKPGTDPAIFKWVHFYHGCRT